MKPKIRKYGDIWLCSVVLTVPTSKYGRYHINWSKAVGKGDNPSVAYHNYIEEEKRLEFVRRSYP